MKSFEFNFLNTPYIIFGRNTIAHIGEQVREYGSSATLVVSKTIFETKGVREIIEEILAMNGIDYSIFYASKEPTCEDINEGIDYVRRIKSDVIVCIGGGSAIDTGKAIAGITTNEGKTEDYMEVFKTGKILKNPAKPIIAIPTTAGTGSEATRNAVVLSKKLKVKSSIRSNNLIPKVAIIDSEIMVHQSKELTASCGMDALTQLIESYTSSNSQLITDSLALLGIRKALESLVKVYEDGNDISAREDMAFAALLSGICLANAGLGAVHGFAGSIGGLLPIPHGVICGALLAPVIEENIRTMLRNIPFHPFLAKYARLGEIARDLSFEDIREAMQSLIDYMYNITAVLKIPKFEDYGLKEDNFQQIIENAQKSSSMRYNPATLNLEQMEKILRKATFRS
ncbi:MAG: iron-containing alcohol dehydrogenase [Candidatus Thorarchaeota archaeon]